MDKVELQAQLHTSLVRLSRSTPGAYSFQDESKNIADAIEKYVEAKCLETTEVIGSTVGKILARDLHGRI